MERVWDLLTAAKSHTNYNTMLPVATSLMNISAKAE